MAVGSSGMNQDEVSKSGKHEIMEELLETRRLCSQITFTQLLWERNGEGLLPRAGFAQQHVRATHGGVGPLVLCGWFLSVPGLHISHTWVCIHKHFRGAGVWLVTQMSSPSCLTVPFRATTPFGILIHNNRSIQSAWKTECICVLPNSLAPSSSPSLVDTVKF